VIAPTAAEADAMSTAAFVAGVAGTEQLLRLKPYLAAVVLADAANPDAPGAPLIFNLDADAYSPPAD
jgi:thiamine biosynthesis lipoprotein